MNMSQSLKQSFFKSIQVIKKRKGIGYLIIIVTALAAFEAFNYSTTDFALSDLLGDLRFAGIRWATILSVAFCGIDFAGIARLFTPETGKDEPRTTWYLFGAWILAATMNAILTWWGVVMAMQTHPVLSAGMVDATFVSQVVPIFIALMVWIIRILIIGNLSAKGDQILHQAVGTEARPISRREYRQAQSRAAHPELYQQIPAARAAQAIARPAPKPARRQEKHQREDQPRPEPAYIPFQEEAAYRSLSASSRQKRVQ
jgi:hypothetical protein